MTTVPRYEVFVTATGTTILFPEPHTCLCGRYTQFFQQWLGENDLHSGCYVCAMERDQHAK